MFAESANRCYPAACACRFKRRCQLANFVTRLAWVAGQAPLVTNPDWNCWGIGFAQGVPGHAGQSSQQDQPQPGFVTAIRQGLLPS